MSGISNSWANRGDPMNSISPHSTKTPGGEAAAVGNMQTKSSSLTSHTVTTAGNFQKLTPEQKEVIKGLFAGTALYKSLTNPPNESRNGPSPVMGRLPPNPAEKLPEPNSTKTTGEHSEIIYGSLPTDVNALLFSASWQEPGADKKLSNFIKNAKNEDYNRFCKANNTPTYKENLKLQKLVDEAIVERERKK